MKVKRRHSTIKYRKITGFLTRMKTYGGRRILRNRRLRRKNMKSNRP